MLHFNEHNILIWQLHKTVLTVYKLCECVQIQLTCIIQEQIIAQKDEWRKNNEV